MEPQEKIVKLQSSEGEQFEIYSETIEMCNTIKNMLKEGGSSKRSFKNSLGGCFSIENGHAILKKEGRVLASLNNVENCITLHDVKSDTLEKVLDFCKFHSNTGISEREKKEWNTQFVQVDQNLLCELASASYYLDIKSLVNLTSRAIATQVSGKTSEELRETFYSMSTEFHSSHLARRYRLLQKLNKRRSDNNNKNNTNNTIEERQTQPRPPAPINVPASKRTKNQKQKERRKRKRQRLRQNKKENQESKETVQQKNTKDEVNITEVPIAQNQRAKENQQLEFLLEILELDPDSEEFELLWKKVESNIDPTFKARVDKEVEEWRYKLEQINSDPIEEKIPLPINHGLFMSKCVGVR
eukprot:TRINITY_DN5853_c0_g1_i1.p1 TRINITY_DN5853_c0_g1~~TRINITY_DN5853_c0_g1_i1.p1  ORF type:complete len:357 (-),score=75.51 TRINITY_DN5853_c0_g1_i1:73-1143(-)